MDKIAASLNIGPDGRAARIAEVRKAIGLGQNP
jgi:hypothetical protein